MEAVAAVALIEKVSARVLSHYSFGDKIGLSHDTLHLGVSIFLYVAKLKVFGSNYFAGHALTTLFSVMPVYHRDSVEIVSIRQVTQNLISVEIHIRPNR